MGERSGRGPEGASCFRIIDEEPKSLGRSQRQKFISSKGFFFSFGPFLGAQSVQGPSLLINYLISNGRRG